LLPVPPLQAITLQGTVADDSVFVLRHSNATDATILAAADQSAYDLDRYNGDDALVLRHNGIVIDVIGQVGFDPGGQWGSGDTSTENNTLRRRPPVCIGDTTTADAFLPAETWIGFPANSFDGLGTHTVVCNPLDDFVLHPASGEQKYPQVAYNPDDDEYLVVWQDSRNGVDWDIFGQRINGDSSLIGDNIHIGISGTLPVVSYSPDDNAYLVVWESSQLSKEQTWSGKEIWGQAVAASGTLSGTAFTVYDFTAAGGSGERPDIVYSEANDEFLVSWESPPGRNGILGSHYQLRTRQATINGATGTSSMIATKNTRMADTALSAASDGSYLIVWQDEQNTSDDIYGRILTAAGAGSGSEFAVISTLDTEQQPDVAWNEAADAYLVTWYDSGGFIPQGIQSRLVLTTGATSGVAVRVSDAGEANNPSVIADSEGWLIGWQQPEGATGNDLYGRSVGNNGLVDGDSSLLTASNGDQQFPIFSGADNRFLLTWQGDREGDWDIYASLYQQEQQQTTHIAYEYDDLYRLITAVYSGDIEATYAYNYDAVGNMTAYTDTVDASITAVSRAFDVANRLQSSTDTGSGENTTFTYDDNGNLIRQITGLETIGYDYDQRNLLMLNTRQMGMGPTAPIAAYTYDGTGNRLRQTSYSSGSPAEVITYTNDIMGLTQVLVANDGAKQVYNLYGLDLIGQQASDDPQQRLLLADGLGSVRQEMTGNNVEAITSYNPYGNLLTQTGSSDTTYGYTGEQTDSNGLLYLRARYYNPTQRTFQSRDPWAGDPMRPQSMNGWSYVEGNSVNRVDPTGMIPTLFPDHCRKLHTGSEYARCVRKEYGLRSTDWEVQSQDILHEIAQIIQRQGGIAGCWEGEVPYRAPGYVAGSSVQAGALVSAITGKEKVYDFATMERQIFSYSGHTWTLSAGATGTAYAGKAYGLRSWSTIEEDYRGKFGFFYAGGGVPLGLPLLSISGGILTASGSPDDSVGVVAGYVSLNVGASVLGNIDIGGGYTFYEKSSDVVSYVSTGALGTGRARKVESTYAVVVDINTDHLGDGLYNVPDSLLRLYVTSTKVPHYVDVFNAIHYDSYLTDG